MSWWMVLAVGAAGGVGAAARFVVDGLVRTRWTRVFPLATVVVNVSGSLVIGVITGVALFHGGGDASMSNHAVAVAATGFCGGYTTFSTAMADTVRLIETRHWRLALLNALGTTLVCVGAAAIGVAVVYAATGGAHH